MVLRRWNSTEPPSAGRQWYRGEVIWLDPATARGIGRGLLLASSLGLVMTGCTLDRAGGLALGPGGSSSGTGSVGGTGAGGVISTGGFGGTGGTGPQGGQGGAGGVVDPVCGDGVTDGDETCDDQNTVEHDGCHECQTEPGFTCDGTPSVCLPIAPQIAFEGPSLNVSIYDGQAQGQKYDGTISTMDCVDLTVGNTGFHSVQRVRVTVGIDHNYVGDLVIKLFSPLGTESTLMSRPGVAETADTYSEPSGESSNLTASSPITFRDDATDSAEDMGDTIPDYDEICYHDNRCEYLTAPGAGPGSSLADFNGEDPVGIWKLCVADADDIYSGTIQSVSLSVLAW